MTEKLELPGDGPDAGTFRVLGVEGWASDSYGSGDPAVVVNPGASGNTLLSWGVGQLDQIDRLMSVMTSSHSDVKVDPADVIGPLHHQITQTLVVLREAANRLDRERREAGRSHC